MAIPHQGSDPLAWIPDPQLTDEDVQEYVKIVKKAFGVKMTLEEGRASATRYLRLLTMLSQPLPSRGDKKAPADPKNLEKQRREKNSNPTAVLRRVEDIRPPTKPER